MYEQAQTLASKGRHGDSVLVHMNPQEVSGLQALARSHGKTMTVNPDTGLPEAFNLRGLLPMVIGAGLAATGIGAPAAAMLTGAGYTAATGSLKKGLMAGLGAYSGAGLGEGLVSAGQTVTPPPTPLPSVAGPVGVSPDVIGGAGGTGMTALQAPSPSISSLVGQPSATQGLTGMGRDSFMQLDPLKADWTLSTAAPQSLAVKPLPSAVPSAPLGASAVMPTVTNPPPLAEPSFATAQRGAEALFGGNDAARTAFMEKVGGPTGLAMKGAGAFLAGYEPPKPNTPPVTETMIRPYTFAWNEQTGAYEPRPTPGDTSERYYVSPEFTAGTPYKAAQGGLMGYQGYATGGNPSAIDMSDSYDDERGYDGSTKMAVGGLTAFKRGGESGRPDSRKLMGQDPYSFQTTRESMLDATERNFAMGGQPRFLSGGGDGMSDSIPAMIGDHQPARLADGEFVIPADVVSHIGNGSSKAGAEKLYGMMDKVRQQRTGKKKQAPAIKAEKYMPA